MTNEPLYNQFSTIVLAGGKSERMGYPKPWLKTVNGYSFLENIINTYHNAGIKNIIVVLNANFSNGVWEVQINQLLNKATFALNHSPHLGRTHTIQLGLDKVTTPYVFIHNVDNPFVKKETIITLLKHSDKSQIIKPVYKSKS
ncbi:MAG: nucleotidyltransferase family protein, partial [Bacteroidia bacterium]|nr:nucleotidyltransferase family protein [Bacteroidia bacterium]